MPVPGKGEKKDDFVERCIPIVIADGTAKDGSQASAICHSIWEQAKEEGAAVYVNLETRETRCHKHSELRLAGTEKEPKITGYAAVFDTWADIGGWFRESIRKGAFAKTIKENDIRALVNHDENYVLGRNRANTLTLREDEKGLAVEIDPAPTVWANDLLVSMRRGDVSQMSFGFSVNKDEYDFETDQRVLVDVTLFDVSVVTFPAYPTTSAQVRSLFAAKRALREKSKAAIEPIARVLARLESGAAATAEEIRLLDTFVKGLAEPPEKHSASEPEPPEKHSASQAATGGTGACSEGTNALLIRTARLLASKEGKA